MTWLLAAAIAAYLVRPFLDVIADACRPAVWRWFQDPPPPAGAILPEAPDPDPIPELGEGGKLIREMIDVAREALKEQRKGDGWRPDE